MITWDTARQYGYTLLVNSEGYEVHCGGRVVAQSLPLSSGLNAAQRLALFKPFAVLAANRHHRSSLERRSTA